jgi:predicted NBD/HSP70 family sugar kinase
MRSLKITRTANSNLQNKINKSIIFNYLREHGPTYRAKISKDLDISAPAVSRVVEQLIDDGYILETDKLKTTSGKPPTQLQINSGKGIVLGIDLLKENVKIAISDFSGNIVRSEHCFKITEGIDVSTRLTEEIDRVLHEFCRDNSLQNHLDSFKAIGVGVPAVIDLATGMVKEVPLYSCLSRINMKEHLGNRYQVPIYIENGVRLAALGEKFYGEGRGLKDIVFVEVSNGIGAGIILDNHLLRGCNGSAGEIGLSILEKSALDFRIKNKGFLEKTASVESLAEQAVAAIADGHTTCMAEMVDHDTSQITPSVVCQAAIKGDRIAGRIISDVITYLSLAIINLILLIDPQVVVLGGELCSLPSVSALFVDPIRAHVRKSLPIHTPNISLSALGEDAGVVGASTYAVNSLLIGEFPYMLEL